MGSNAELLKRAYRIRAGNSPGTFCLSEGREVVIERGTGSRDKALGVVEDTLRGIGGRRGRAA